MARAKTPKEPGIQRVPLENIAADPANVRRRNERAKTALRNSLRRFGAARSIVLDGKGVVRAGNGTLEAAAAEGINEVLVVDAAPNQLVAVRRSDWSTTEATAYAIADNRTAELAEWDTGALASTLESLDAEDFDLGSLGFSEVETAEILSTLAAPETEVTELPELGTMEHHQFVVSYHDDDEPAIRAFLGLPDDGTPLSPQIGKSVLERIKELAVAGAGH